MIQNAIRRLVQYGLQTGLVEKEDEIYTTNRLIELFGLDSPEAQGEQAGGAAQSQTKTADEACHGHACTAGETSRTQVDETGNLEGILKEMLDYAAEKGMLAADSVVYRDLFDTKIMGLLMPRPSEVIRKFYDLYKEVSPEAATDYYYDLSRNSDYIRRYRIARDKKWVTPTEYGDLDITINLSKPEKDPKAIAAAKNAPQSGYPKCLLCKENEGYAGRVNHPARQNHRIIPVTINGSCGASSILLMYITMSTASFLIRSMFL